MIETKSAFAKRINRAPSYITELLSHGRLVLDSTGKKIDVEASLQKLAETSSGANPAVAARHEEARKTPAKKRVSKKQADQESDKLSRASFKSQVLHYENEQLKLEGHLRRGLRFELSDVRREAQNIGNTLRASIERLIDQTAPRLAVMKSTSEKQALLHAEIQKLKTVIKSEFPRSLRRMQKQK